MLVSKAGPDMLREQELCRSNNLYHQIHNRIAAVANLGDAGCDSAHESFGVATPTPSR